MTPQQAQQLAEKEYPFDRIERDSYLLWNEIKEREQAAFLNGLSKTHLWQKVADGWKPENNKVYWVTNGESIQDAYFQCETEQFNEGWYYMSYDGEIEMRLRWEPIYYMPYFFPELPNDQNTQP